jgi:1-acyl-sn-glycerol-3-phosphate acyltransferase
MAPFSTIFQVGKGCIAALILFCNTITVFTAMIPFALIKLLLPFAAVRRLVDHVLNFLAQSWIAINGWWVALVGCIRWEISGLEGLKIRSWYLVSSNHQSWVDIIVLQKIFAGRIPFLKFFLKRELMYVPVMGLAWWALDFPFMRRSGGGRNFSKDLEATRQSCERFRLIPTSVINFLEGTRFTSAKHAAQQSPYQHLLKPKVGGLAMALAVMGNQFNSYLDVTIIYPKGTPSFWDLLCGRVEQIVVRVAERAIPETFVTADYDGDVSFRRDLQGWVQEMWLEKDVYIGEVLGRGASGITSPPKDS